MPRRQGPGLSLAEWLVLCLVSQEPVHGFALAALLAPEGDVGMVWRVQKGEVYRAAQRLERLGLITAEDKEIQPLGAAPVPAVRYAGGRPGRPGLAVPAGGPSPGCPLGAAAQAGPVGPGRD